MIPNSVTCICYTAESDDLITAHGIILLFVNLRYFRVRVRVTVFYDLAVPVLIKSSYVDICNRVVILPDA